MSEAANPHAVADSAPVLLEARGLVKDFIDAGREIHVLRGLDITVRTGEEIAIVGQSGTGKSTLLHVLGSLEVPTAGKVFFQGQDLFALDERALAEFRNLKLGFVFQFHYLLADFDAVENVMMPALIARQPDAEARRRAAEVLELVGLGEKLHRRPAELSGGEQQRVAVARAVVLRPRLVLADEPTGNLDPQTAEEVHGLFHLLSRELGVTLVIATHNERLMRSMGRALRLRDGRLHTEPREEVILQRSRATRRVSHRKIRLLRRVDWLAWLPFFGVSSVTAERAFTRWPRSEVLLALAAAVLFAVARPAFAQGVSPIVSQIRIEGNQRVETDAIKIHISQQAGQPLNRAAVDQDIKAIYDMGFFSHVGVEQEIINGNLVLVYRVTEEPQVTDIRWEGMKEFRPTDDKIVDATKVHPGEILDPRKVKTTIDKVIELYHAKSYLDASVTSSEILEADNTAIVVFKVHEGPKVWIRSIVFHGNHAFSARTLKSVMETGTYNPLLSWVTGWGALDQKKLDDDVNRLTAFYYDNGYLNAHVDQPVVTRHGNSLTVTFDLDEGPLYRVGRLVVKGDLKFPTKDLANLVTERTGQVFEGDKLQHDQIQLSDYYSNHGYAFVTVNPETHLVPNTHRIDITFHIVPGHVVIVNRINITGNTKTSDKVIRRELQIQEQEPYSAEAIRESKARLDRLGFFTSTRITTSPSSQPDKINLDVHVNEANTAALQVAGGFDSYQIFGNFTLGNSNLFGGGESLMLNAQIGYLFQNYSISYTEPWFMDMPLSVSMQLFDNKIFLLSFNQSSAGFAINTFYPLTELGFKKIGPISLKDVTAGLGYQFESVGITGLPPLTTYQILQYKGYTQTSEIMPSIRRFTVDNPVDPRSGSVLSFNGDIGGLGGGNYFLKGVLHGRYFYPFWKSPMLGTFVLSQGVTFGIGTNLAGGTGGELPLYERFFPGGVGGTSSDVRGYQLYSLGPLVTLYNQAGQPISVQNIGGSKELIFSNEITFPLLSGLGLRGVIFSDAGQAYQIQKSIDLTQLQASYGIGIRWRSPFGPLSVDIARPINPRPADLSTVFEIGAGSPL